MSLQTVSLGQMSLQVRQAGTGMPLLFVHGFPLDHQMWNAQFDILAAKYRVIAPDLRGFGGSSSTSGTTTMSDYAADLDQLLTALSIRERVVFCALSMGGYIALQFAQLHRERLRGVILCDTRAATDTAEAAANRLKTADRVLSEGVDFLVDLMIPKLFGAKCVTEQPHIVAATRQVMLSTPRESVAAALRGMAARPDMTTSLASLDLPALVLGGSEDAIVPSEEMATMAEQLPQGRYVEIAGAGHMAPLEAPNEVNPVLEEFLASL